MQPKQDNNVMWDDEKSKEPPDLQRGTSLSVALERMVRLTAIPTIEVHLVQQVERGPLCKRHIVRWLATRLLWFTTQKAIQVDMFTTPCRHSDELVPERCRLKALAHVAITQVLMPAKARSFRGLTLFTFPSRHPAPTHNLAAIVVRSDTKHSGHEYARRCGPAYNAKPAKSTREQARSDDTFWCAPS